MIVFDLRCRRDHVFEAWFPDSASFAEQVESGKVLCPVCGSRKVTKALMAPKVHKGKSGESAAAPERPQGGTLAVADSEKAGELRRMLRELREHVESNCDYVGGEFPEEARKIHYGEVEPRGIYGEATSAEAKELAEEGVEFAQLPLRPRQSS